MSKKQKRNVSSASRGATRGPGNESRPVGYQAPAYSRTAAQSTSLPAPRRGPPPFEFKPDYSIVKRDLVRIGALAGGFVVVLVVLSFILK